MKIQLATILYKKQVIEFFEKYLDKNNEAITWREFLCPFGVSNAIKRNQVMIVLEEDEIVWAVRFYPRKRDNIVSVYQFAISENYRKKGLLRKMLEKTWYKIFEVVCPLNHSFNKYYLKTWWKIEKSDEKFNYLILKIWKDQ